MELKNLQKKKAKDARAQIQVQKNLHEYRDYKIDMVKEGHLPHEVVSDLHSNLPFQDAITASGDFEVK